MALSKSAKGIRTWIETETYNVHHSFVLSIWNHASLMVPYYWLALVPQHELYARLQYDNDSLRGENVPCSIITLSSVSSNTMFTSHPLSQLVRLQTPC